jgi:quercetin dioxygenase-like cupin family protein
MLAALGVAGRGVEPGLAQTASQAVRTAAVIPLPPPYGKQNATFQEVHLAPGQPSRAHRHPGFVLGYVIEGEVRFQVAGEPERILRSGDVFYEAPGAVHAKAESASPDKPARMLAIIIADSSKTQMVEPA